MKRVCSVLLLCSFLAAVLLPKSALATNQAENTETQDLVEIEPGLLGEESEQATIAESAGEIFCEQGEEEPPDEVCPEPGEEEPPDEVCPEPGEEEPSDEVYPVAEEPVDEIIPENARTHLKITNQQKIVTYDDRIDPEWIKKGYSVLTIKTINVFSRQVENGRVTGEKDTDILRLNSDSNQLVACGVGLAEIYLVPSDRLVEAMELLSDGELHMDETTHQAEEENESIVDIPCICCEVTVNPAKLSLFLLAGQSNMEGVCNGGYDRQNSVACTPGTVYSTYIPASGAVQLISGTSLSVLTQSSNWSESVAAYLPASLTDETALNGDKLVYPVNALTAQGGGKTGLDSALGYEWHRLTGEKVWLVNAGWTNTSISRWVPGGICSERAVAAFSSAIQVLQAEVSAGHYTAGRRILFWLQGEADRNMDADSYNTAFRSVCNYYQEKCDTQCTGIISVRAASQASKYRGYKDITLTGPRIAQYGIASSTSDNHIFMLSNSNETWISDQKVRDWFETVYPMGKLSYPMHVGGNNNLPTTEIQVHPSIHFTQLGHNENGFTAARGLYNIINGKSVPKSIFWLCSDGKIVKDLIQPEPQGQGVLLVCPITALKQVKWEASGEMSFTPSAGVVSISKNSMGTIRCTYGTQTIGTLTAAMCAAPSGLKAVNVNGGVQVSWNAVRNAENYRVYYRLGSGAWQFAGNTQKTSLMVKNLISGNQYTFTVRCINASATAFTSGYDKTGVSVTYVAAPVLRSVKVGNGTATLVWNPSPGAVRYRIYYKKTNANKWTGAGSTGKCNFTLNRLSKGSYVFTVRCISADGTCYISGYNTAGMSFNI